MLRNLPYIIKKIINPLIIGVSIVYALYISLLLNTAFTLLLLIPLTYLLYIHMYKPLSMHNTNNTMIGTYNGIVYVNDGGHYIGTKYLIVEELPYTTLELNRIETIRYIRNFSSFLANVKPGTEVRLIKDTLNINKFLSKLESEISTLKIMKITDPTNMKIQRRLALLERIRSKILKGERPTKLYILVGIRKHAKSLDELIKELKREAHEVSTLITTSLGLKVKELNINDIRQLINPNLIPLKYSKTLLEGDLQIFTPLEPYKRPTLNVFNGIYLGIDMDTKSSIILDIEKYCSRHMIVVGPTGKGKTTLLAVIALRSSLILNNIATIVLDFKGDLISLLRKYDAQVISPINGDYINILNPPPNISRTAWASIITTILSKTLNLNAPEDFILYNTIIKSYEIQGSAANMKTVIEILQKDNNIYSKSIALKLQASMDKSIMISTLKIPEEHGLYLIDLSTIDDRIRELYATALLLHIFYTLTGMGLSSKLRALIIIDEAWRLTKGGIEVLKRLYKEGRGYGIGTIVSTQNFEDLPLEVLENAGTLIAFGANTRDYAVKVAKYMELTTREVERLLWLKTGEAVIKLYDDPRPMWIKIDAEEVVKQP